MPNPFEFHYDARLDDYDFATPLGKSHWTEETVIGQSYLKMRVRYTERRHSGYCSDYDFEAHDDASKWDLEDEILTVYMKIPAEFLNTDGSFKAELLDGDGNLSQEHDNTESFYESWVIASDCVSAGGSGCCNLYDSYVPISIEYVGIV
jgi:hypothetical protein